MMEMMILFIKQSKIIKARMQAVGADYQGSHSQFNGIFLSLWQQTNKKTHCAVW